MTPSARKTAIAGSNTGAGAAASTTCVSAAEVEPRWVASAGTNSAVTEWSPAARSLVARVAVPSVTGEVPRVVAPSRNVT
ncbi:hypothetical protein GCM10025875_27540 [Litorihabitans aurantiacus]|uniref:Uncharacterized protein n=1 Tax=Litorihabitans aurantiacus TaxID=1930061 RepID=A0AA37XGF1_9MICO|nr:hypothetical protein [Litorihabitans aurantiacus]GMA32762.1 hypothetical protein GCM10025875_27540 [Litorihabitans aurantiacus]